MIAVPAFVLTALSGVVVLIGKILEKIWNLTVRMLSETGDAIITPRQKDTTSRTEKGQSGNNPEPENHFERHLAIMLLIVLAVVWSWRSCQNRNEPLPVVTEIESPEETYNRAFDDVVIARAYLDGVQTEVDAKCPRALVGFKFINDKPVKDYDFNGKTYEVTAEALLLRSLGPASEPYIVASELVSYGISPQEDGTAESMLVVRQRWSTGEEREQPYYAVLDAVVYSEVLKWIEISGYKNDLSIRDAYLTEGTLVPTSSEDKFVSVYLLEQDYVVEYNYFTVPVRVSHSVATYDDGVTVLDFPSYDFNSLENSFTFEKGNTDEDEDGFYQWYTLKHTVKASLADGSLTKEGTVRMNVRVQL